MEDSLLAFLDWGSKLLRLVDGSGGLIREFGGDGEGPGELRRPASLHLCGQDTLVVRQVYSLEMFHRRDGFIRRLTAAIPSRVHLLDVAADCRRFLAYGSQHELPPTGEIGFTRRPVVFLDQRLEVAKALVVDSIPNSLTLHVSGGPPYPIAVVPPWSPKAAWAVDGGHVLRAEGGAPEVHGIDGSGTVVRIIRWAQSPDPVTAADRNLYEEKHRRMVQQYGDEPTIRLIFPGLGAWPSVPATKPYTDGILIDDRSRIWVRRHPGTMVEYWQYPPIEPEPPQRWMVFDSTGSWLTEIQLPRGFALHSVREDRVAGVYTDSLDVESVRVHRLRN